VAQHVGSLTDARTVPRTRDSLKPDGSAKAPALPPCLRAESPQRFKRRAVYLAGGNCVQVSPPPHVHATHSARKDPTTLAFHSFEQPRTAERSPDSGGLRACR